MKTRRPSILGWSIISAGVVASVSAIGRSAPQSSGGSAEGIAAFETVRAVLQHPRCQNCHIPADAPLQFDEGRPHGQNVQRGPSGRGSLGLRCVTCHFGSNPPPSYGLHMPPGAPNWRLPPPETKMVFIGLSSGDLCRGVKNPKANGGRDLDTLLEHVSNDKLVLWGWDPGLGRNPVSVPHAEFVAKFQQWVAAGAPCPK